MVMVAGLYLHIPFCEHKCIYCDFYSIESMDPMERFLGGLRQEIRRYAEYGRGEQFETIFFGGGTPSLLDPPVVGELLGLLHSTYRIAPGAEVTLETNPGTVDRARLRQFRAEGINRLSFGVQSFHDDDLKFLTRIHSSDQARQSVWMAQEAGFENINIDLIFALPNQTIQRWEENLAEAAALGTQHISAYSLIVEKGTPLARMVDARMVAPLPTDAEAEMFEFTMQYLGAAGFEHYEVSNYARPGFRSIHNSNYWNHSNYLGFGPSAHSFWGNRRWWNIRSVDGYCEKLEGGVLPLAGDEFLTAEQLVEEAIMLGLRSNGIDLERLTNEYGMDLLDTQPDLVTALEEEGLVTVADRKLCLTDRGFLICDEISGRFLEGLPASCLANR